MLSTGAIVAIVAVIVLLIAAFVVSTVGSSSSSGASDAGDASNANREKEEEKRAPESNLFCERRHLNYAWGYQNDGMYVDGIGNVYRFNASDRQPFVDRKNDEKSNVVTLAALRADRFDKNRTFVKTLTDEELQSFRNMFAQVENENLGLGEKQGGAFDYGLVNTTCYASKDGSDVNTPMRVYELDLDGDTRREAVGENARILAVWLRGLDRSTASGK